MSYLWARARIPHVVIGSSPVYMVCPSLFRECVCMRVRMYVCVGRVYELHGSSRIVNLVY